MLGLSKTRTILLLGFAFFCLSIIFSSVDGGSLKYHKRFAKHLYKFMKKEKYFFKKKGLGAAAILALSHVKKSVVCASSFQN